MNKPRITVLMPVYNGEKYIGEAIESILNQTFANYEFVIIDDCSTDKSKKNIQTYHDPRINFISNNENLGLINTLNIGLALAQGEYIARMDQDDISLPQRLEKQLAFLDNHPEIGVCGTGFKTINQKGASTAVTQFPNQSSLLNWQLHFFCPLVHPTVMMKTSLVKKVGGYNKNATYYEDYDLWVRLCSITQLTNLDDILFCLRKHKENTSQTHLSEQTNNSIKICWELISKTLNKDVSVDIVRQLYLNDYADVNAAIQISNLIRKLYDSFINRNKLTSQEIILIRNDVARRLFSLTGRFWHNIRTWKIMITVLIFDPWFIFKGIKYLFKKFVRNSY